MARHGEGVPYVSSEVRLEGHRQAEEQENEEDRRAVRSHLPEDSCQRVLSSPHVSFAMGIAVLAIYLS
jgi:hypothetical protein